MKKVLTSGQMRDVDRLTIEQYGIPSILLMENAAHAVADVVREQFGGSVEGRSIVVLCGKGNNGGDGAALARILGMSGARVNVVLLGKISETTADARVNFEILCRRKHSIAHVYSSKFGELREIRSVKEWREFYLHTGNSADIIVDAIFGTGLTRPLESWAKAIVHELNSANEDRPANNRICVSIDLPSGLNADIGSPIGEYIKSDVTVTFTAPKPANILPGTASCNGQLIVADIGSPPELIHEQPSQIYLAERSDAQEWIKRSEFSESSYKNKRGHALVIAGSRNYSGAAVLAGNAGIRSGAGLITLAVPEASRDGVIGRVTPEVMVRGLSQTDDGSAAEKAADEINEFIDNVDAIAIGSGLSAKEDETKSFVRRIVSERVTPVVIDADALTALSPWETKGSDDLPLILTPHEGEFKRLLGVEGSAAEDALRDRVSAVREFAIKFNLILVLKGERALIAAADGRVAVNPTGNAGLGKAGNGDTLTGIVVGFVAQAVQMKIDIFESVVAAVYIAGSAGDEAERKFGKRVMTASDVRDCLSNVFESLK